MKVKFTYNDYHNKRHEWHLRCEELPREGELVCLTGADTELRGFVKSVTWEFNDVTGEKSVEIFLGDVHLPREKRPESPPPACACCPTLIPGGIMYNHEGLLKKKWHWCDGTGAAYWICPECWKKGER